MNYKVYASEAYVNEETSAKINELKNSGGVGYLEGETVHTIDPKFLPSLSGGISIVDLSDVINLATMEANQTTEVSLTQEHWERIGNDYAPKLIVGTVSGDMKFSALVTPSVLWSESCIDYSGLFTVDGGILILSLIKDESDGYSAALIDVPV